MSNLKENNKNGRTTTYLLIIVLLLIVAGVVIYYVINSDNESMTNTVSNSATNMADEINLQTEEEVKEFVLTKANEGIKNVNGQESMNAFVDCDTDTLRISLTEDDNWRIFCWWGSGDTSQELVLSKQGKIIGRPEWTGTTNN